MATSNYMASLRWIAVSLLLFLTACGSDDEVSQPPDSAPVDGVIRIACAKVATQPADTCTNTAGATDVGPDAPLTLIATISNGTSDPVSLLAEYIIGVDCSGATAMTWATEVINVQPNSVVNTSYGRLCQTSYPAGPNYMTMIISLNGNEIARETIPFNVVN